LLKLSSIRSLVNILNVFSTPFDAIKCRRLYYKKSSELNEVSLSVKEVRGKIVVRPNTTDAKVLLDTFYEKYHLPPVKLQDDAIILDLGTNVGYTMLHFANLYPKSRLYGVEMDIGNFMQAKKNLKRLGNQCNLIHAAVWSDDGRIKYDTQEEEWGFKVNYEDPKKEKSSFNEVPSKTLDTIFEEFNLKRVDYLKMDIEGAEKFVLERLGNWINIVKSMKIEIHPPAEFSTCLQTLEKYGFRCYKDDKHPSAIVAIKDNTQ